MEENNNGHTLSNLLSDAFCIYAKKRPAQTAAVIESMIKGDSDETEEIDMVSMRRAASLLLSMPDALAADIVSRVRILTEDGREPIIELLIYEMARAERFDEAVFADALSEFTKREAHEPFGGIDRARAILERVYPAERLVGMINDLTDQLIEQNKEIPEDVQ